MIREGLQYRSVIVIMLTVFLLIGFFSMGMRFASAGPSYQTHYNGWNKDTGDGKTQQSPNDMGMINTTIPKNSTILKSQEVSNNHGCDPTHQFCAMTPK